MLFFNLITPEKGLNCINPGKYSPNSIVEHVKRALRAFFAVCNIAKWENGKIK
jgi:hypothetical protein